MSSATGTTTIVVATRPTAASVNGGSAVASAKKSSVPANRAATSSAQPAPAVARVRRRSPRALSRRPLHRGHQAAEHGQRQADQRYRWQRLSERDGAHRSEAAGQRTQRRDHREVAGREPLEERPQAEELEDAARGGEPRRPPLLVAAGQAVDDERQRHQDGKTDQHDPSQGRPERGRPHDAEQQVIVDGVAEGGAEPEDDGKHPATLLDASRCGRRAASGRAAAHPRVRMARCGRR